ncbi:MAG: sialidase family protein, partial [Nitrospirota bacterium]|nr:sialidase family protein [Nitrospirota bacterium]
MLNLEKLSNLSSPDLDLPQEPQHVAIVKNQDRHLAFPDISSTRSGYLLVVYREGAEHVDSSGKIMLVRGGYSQNQLHFASPQCVCNTDLDDRDPSIVELANGTLIINFFRLDRETGQLFLTVSQSLDKGENWCSPQDISFPSFSEGLATSDAIVEMASGDLVMAVYGKADDGKSGAYLVRSNDGGMTWPVVTGLALCQAPIFEEPAIVLHPGGRLIAFLRTDNRGLGYIYRTESADEGYTWTSPERLDLWGYPADLFALKNGSVLATYGYRQFPAGVRYCQSTDGQSWSIYHERILRADGHD